MDEAADKTEVSAEWALVGGQWRERVKLSIAGGRIGAVTPHEGPCQHHVMVPALHNAHSHVFQWAMRGRTHHLTPEAPEDDFWSWRRRMYALANTLDPARLEDIATQAYTAMVARGFASVCEFHYVHHDPHRGRYTPPWSMGLALARAAASAGIRLRLLPIAYHRAGHGRPASAEQARFTFDAVDSYISFVRDTREALEDTPVTVGFGAHSVRAVPREWLEAIADAADTDETVLHIHASEQVRELEECLDEHGVTPVQLLHDVGFLGPSTTVVHATHLRGDELELIADTGTCVCACPTTERDLGDGFIEAKRMMDLNIPVAIGTDSHTNLDPVVELHLLEFHERLRYQRRNVLTSPDHGIWRPSQQLLHWGAASGARALGLDSGTLREGSLADMIALFPESPVTSEAEAWAVVDGWLFSHDRATIERVYVAGQ